MSKQDEVKPTQPNQKKFEAEEDKGAARRAADKQIGETAQPVKHDRKGPSDPLSVDNN